jgi:hypothetical protein
MAVLGGGDFLAADDFGVPMLDKRPATVRSDFAPDERKYTKPTVAGRNADESGPDAMNTPTDAHRRRFTPWAPGIRRRDFDALGQKSHSPAIGPSG